jgi:hypothetical protein
MFGTDIGFLVEFVHRIGSTVFGLLDTLVFIGCWIKFLKDTDQSGLDFNSCFDYSKMNQMWRVKKVLPVLFHNVHINLKIA